jgi:predicted RNA binding protein YcfA (HicA-like mRNA interferase family)
MTSFPSMKAKRLLAVLMREPLNYRVARRSGSHRRLKALGRPSFTLRGTTAKICHPVRSARCSSAPSALPNTRPSIYSEAQPMEPIEITYRHEPGYGWAASSSDLRLRFDESLTAGDTTFETTRARVEDALRWALARDDLEFQHYIHQTAVPAFVAEQEQTAAKA